MNVTFGSAFPFSVTVYLFFQNYFDRDGRKMLRVFIGAGKTLGSAQIYYWLLQTLVGFGAPRCFTFIK